MGRQVHSQDRTFSRTAAPTMPDPTRLAPQDVAAFLRKYRLSGGRLRRVRVQYPRAKQVAVEFHLTVHEATKTPATEAKAVRLVLRLEGVEEYRFQMRPGQPKVRISDARIGYLNGLFVLARAIGLIGHALDQQRLRQPLYRHPW